jgi:hypothetical protein
LVADLQVQAREQVHNAQARLDRVRRLVRVQRVRQRQEQGAEASASEHRLRL